MNTLLNVKVRRRRNGALITLSAAIAIDTTYDSTTASSRMIGKGETVPSFDSLSFEERSSCLSDLEEALMDTIERYI